MERVKSFISTHEDHNSLIFEFRISRWWNVHQNERKYGKKAIEYVSQSFIKKSTYRIIKLNWKQI